MYFYRYKIDEFYFTIVEDKGFIVEVSLDDKEFLGSQRETPLLRATARELAAYFKGEIKKFTIPIKHGGTDFQNKVWSELTKIPFGEVRTYKDIAINIGNPKSYRAVGNANNKNPLLILVPCHRVVGTGGDIGGFSCGVQLKRSLLELEKDS